MSWPDVLGRSALGAALLWATLPLAGLLFVSAWTSGAKLWDTALGVALIVGIAFLRDGRGLGALGFSLILLHLTAAAVWLGGVVELVIRRDQRRAVARRFGPVGLAAVVVLVATGIWNVRVHTGGRPLAGDYEHVLGLKIALVVAAIGVAAVARRRMRARGDAPSRRLIGGEAGLLATAVAAAAILTALPAAAAAGPTVRVTASGGRTVVRSGARTFTLSGRDADECASHTVGVVLGGGDPHRMSCSTNDSDAPQFGAAFARFLGDKTVSSAVVVTDDSPRSRAMTETFVRTARVQGIAVDVVDAASEVHSWGDAAVITSSWSDARAALDAIAAASAPPIRGAFLAPWLLSSSVSASPGRVQLSIGLPFDPSESSVGVYLTQVATRARGAIPSASGLEGWLAARGVRRQTPTAIQFFTPARIDILPPSLEAGHTHGGTDWVSGGQMAAVSGLVRLDG
ncbi:MAG: CopD family protein [Acidimicrobiia bacterium]|nr:CopD family protein [Acidimicrobiia bacterium]